MRVAKSLTGWLCFLSLIGFLVFAGYWLYMLGEPFFRGAAIYELPVPDAISVANAIGARGIGADNDALLKGFVGRKVVPVNQHTGVDALRWIAQRGSIPQALPPRNVLIAAVLDEKGRVVSAYPKALVGLAFPFDGPIWDPDDNIRYDVDGVLCGHDRSAYDPWGKNFLRETRRYAPGAGDVYRNQIERPAHDAYNALVVVSPDSMAVTHMPGGLQPDYMVAPNHARNLAIAGLLLYLILLPVWTGMDATWRGMRPFAWGILVALTGWIGLLAYLTARLPAPGTCYNCGEKVLGKYVRCPSCGVALLNRCPVCQSKMKPGWEYCPVCDGIQREAHPPQTVQTKPHAPVPVTAAEHGLGVSVIDADSGAPVRGARIDVKGPTNLNGITSPKGTFSARKLREGQYAVSATAQGYEPATTELEMDTAGSKTVTLKVKSLPGRVVGRVVDRVSQAAVAGARVFVDTNRLDRSALTDSQGGFALNDVPSGPYTVQAKAEGFVGQTKLVQVAPDQQVLLDFTLEPVRNEEDRHAE